MNIIKASNLACPIDGGLLTASDKQLICSRGHSFDIAKQGYINLLPVQHKRSKEPGDSKEMVSARTQFLNAGVYEPIAKKLTEINQSLIQKNNNETVCIVDAGCGEGYYFNYILNRLSIKPGNSQLSFIGVDISKHAVVAASKRNTQITWLVGTNRQAPIASNSVDIINCVFGFQSFDGFTKIMKRGAYIILVEPGPDHLKELREIIYTDIVKTEQPNLSVKEKLDFTIINNEQLQFKTGDLDNNLISKLLLMTPHFFRANKTGRETATKLEKLNLTVDIVFTVLRKIEKTNEVNQ